MKWDVRLNSPKERFNIRIAGQEKAYAEKADTEKYLNGRIHAYEKLFTELSPPIPFEHREYFKVSERLLPGYRLEGEEPQVEKTSVIGQLSDAKKQTNIPADKGGKKKEDIQI